MTESIVVTLVCSILGSSAVFGLIQFIVQRYDSHHDRYASVLTEISGLRKDIEALHGDVDKIAVVNARIRILDASDQIRRKVKHSEEYFNQINDDITLYNRYCDAHPDFKNNRAVHAIENINRAYAQTLANNDFL